MKRLKSQYIFRHVRRVAAGLIGCCLLTACSDWFDVAPKTDLTAEKLYSTESGFESALTGIYLSMVTTEAYGGNMSFGLLDQLAQEYDYLPDGAVDQTAIYNYATTTSAGFATKQKLAQSWLKLYNVISNCNNFLKWLDSKGEQVIRNENTPKTSRSERCFEEKHWLYGPSVILIYCVPGDHGNMTQMQPQRRLSQSLIAWKPIRKRCHYYPQKTSLRRC